jgi:hypothetical protein
MSFLVIEVCRWCIKNYIFFEVKKYLESLIFGVTRNWLSKIEKKEVFNQNLAKLWRVH